MDGRLGLAEPGEQRLRALLAGGAQRRAVDQADDLGQRAMTCDVRLALRVPCVLVRMVIVVVRRWSCAWPADAPRRGRELRGANAGTHHALGPDRIRRQSPGCRARARTSSSGTPASISAPRIMSPDAPEKQSKYRTFKICQSYQPAFAQAVSHAGGCAPTSTQREVALVGQDQM